MGQPVDMPAELHLAMFVSMLFTLLLMLVLISLIQWWNISLLLY